jgi:hypothetical protein
MSKPDENLPDDPAELRAMIAALQVERGGRENLDHLLRWIA